MLDSPFTPGVVTGPATTQIRITSLMNQFHGKFCFSLHFEKYKQVSCLFEKGSGKSKNPGDLSEGDMVAGWTLFIFPL